MNKVLGAQEFINIFMLFGGLFGYYSLQRLLPMKLFALDLALKSPIELPKFLSSLLRFLLGCFANLIVALSFLASWKWFSFLTPDHFPLSFGGNLAALSIAISSSSLILVSHRIVAGVAILSKKPLFDHTIWASSNHDKQHEFESFLNSEARSHFVGALLFVVFQLLFGFAISQVF